MVYTKERGMIVCQDYGGGQRAITLVELASVPTTGHLNAETGAPRACPRGWRSRANQTMLLLIRASSAGDIGHDHRLQGTVDPAAGG